jgi:hypothetical protein
MVAIVETIAMKRAVCRDSNPISDLGVELEVEA